MITCTQCKCYVGYTTGKMVKRISNDKCHIKKGKRTCEIVNHFLDLEHNLDFSSHKNFDSSLSKVLKVIFLDRVIFKPGMNQNMKEKACEKLEGYWQTQLRTLNRDGGLNKRDNRKYTTAN